MMNYKIGNFWNFDSLTNFQNSENQILKLIIHLILRTTRYFANSHICPSISFNFEVLTSQFLFSILVILVSSAFLDLNVR